MFFDILFSTFKNLFSWFIGMLPLYDSYSLPDGFLTNIGIISAKAYVLTQLPIVRVVHEVFLWWFPIVLVLFFVRLLIRFKKIVLF